MCVCSFFRCSLALFLSPFCFAASVAGRRYLDARTKESEKIAEENKIKGSKWKGGRKKKKKKKQEKAEAESVLSAKIKAARAYMNLALLRGKKECKETFMISLESALNAYKGLLSSVELIEDKTLFEKLRREYESLARVGIKEAEALRAEQEGLEMKEVGFEVKEEL